MTSRDVIASLNEHLLHALKAEKGRSQECEAMKTSLEKYQRKFSVIIHQQVSLHLPCIHMYIFVVCPFPCPSPQGVLYKEYSDSKKEWEREREQLRQRVREMEAVTEAQEIRHQELKVHVQPCTICTCIHVYMYMYMYVLYVHVHCVHVHMWLRQLSRRQNVMGSNPTRDN